MKSGNENVGRGGRLGGLGGLVGGDPKGRPESGGKLGPGGNVKSGNANVGRGRRRGGLGGLVAGDPEGLVGGDPEGLGLRLGRRLGGLHGRRGLYCASATSSSSTYASSATTQTGSSSFDADILF